MNIPAILVLAGQRSGTVDPLARKMQVSHKCLVPIGGEALIAHVLKTLERALPDATILVSIEDSRQIENEPTVARLAAAGKLRFVDAKLNLADSVIHAAAKSDFPLLITTADNVLLTPEAVHAVDAEGSRIDAEAIVVFAPKDAIRAAHPGGKNRYYEFRDGGYSNCNLFWIRERRALHAVEPFRQGGQFLKVRGRILKTFGLVNALRFRSGWFTLRQMLRHLSRRMKVRVAPLVLSDGRLAIDVDDEKSYDMVREITANIHGLSSSG